ncbi:MAG: PEP-CTERM sorting domain-containing protein [Pirellulales bacterium]|nr:PEP-CTERM sorting domain-containing protein [Pirellulales bacterium]
MRCLLPVSFLLIAMVAITSPSPVLAEWIPSGVLVDLQGDNAHGGYGNQKGPIDYTFQNGETGNYCNMKAEDANGGSDPTPKSWSLVPNDPATIAGTTATLTILAPTTGTEDLVGWAGTDTPPGIVGERGLNTDYMLVLASGNSYGVTTDGSYDFEITGLLASTRYRLGLVTSNLSSTTSGLDFSFADGATCGIRPAVGFPVGSTNYVTVQSDATGKIAGTASLSAGCTQGEWAGMSLDLALPDPVRQWNLDFGGDGTYTNYGQDDHPHPHQSDEFGQWNALSVMSTTGAGTVDPTIVMADSTGDSTNPVTFTATGTYKGWTGIPGEDTGDSSLRKDDIILPKNGPRTLYFELSGLQSGGDYYLTLISGSATDTRRHLDITVDLDGDGDLGDETSRRITSTLVGERTVFFTANAEGRLVGTAYFDGSAGEGDLAGLRLALVPEPGSLVLLLTLFAGGLFIRRRR